MHYPKKRYNHTLAFLQKVLPAPANILDLGTPNAFGKIMKQAGYTVYNTQGEDLDTQPGIVKNFEVDAVTAFEIFEHLIAPFNVLRAIEADKLITTIPLRLWFATAYRSKTDEWDWHIKATEKWTSPVNKIGFRPILRKYTPRYYAIYAER
ncbi:MAG: methyltransferase [Flavobacteriales bacterium]|nr:MAG: methyltransferase [Flavobacteriales bacterium]